MTDDKKTKPRTSSAKRAYKHETSGKWTARPPKKEPARAPLSDDDYAAMADDYAAHPITADEVLSVEATGTVMRMGRPTKASGRTGGKTPSTTVRLPQEIREELARRAEGEHVSASEIVRRALVEHFAAH